MNLSIQKKTGGKAESVFLFCFFFFFFLFFFFFGCGGVGGEGTVMFISWSRAFHTEGCWQVLVILQPQSSPGLTLLCVFRQFESPLCFSSLSVKVTVRIKPPLGLVTQKEQRNNLKPLSQWCQMRITIRRKICSGSYLEGVRAFRFSGLISELGFSDQTQDVKFEFQINKGIFFLSLNMSSLESSRILELETLLDPLARDNKLKCPERSGRWHLVKSPYF